jgi:hypothetical protein
MGAKEASLWLETKGGGKPHSQQLEFADGVGVRDLGRAGPWWCVLLQPVYPLHDMASGERKWGLECRSFKKFMLGGLARSVENGERAAMGQGLLIVSCGSTSRRRSPTTPHGENAEH